MVEYNFFYPEMRITLGTYKFDAGVHFEVFSSKDTPIDWATIKFTKVMPLELTLNKGDEVIIELGYNDNFDIIFSGNVQLIEGSKIVVKDKMQKMKDASIAGLYLQATPQEILVDGLGIAGITNKKLASESFSQQPRVMIRSMNGLDLVKEINRIWGLNYVSYMDTDGNYHWAAKIEQTQVYSFVYGENIIDFEHRDGFMVLETIAAGFIKHSHKVIVKHPDASGEVEVCKVRYFVTENGFPRTEIWFKG